MAAAQSVDLRNRDLRSRFPGVINLLRFFRAANQLYMIDRFANAPDSRTALEVLREMESIVLRLTPKTIEECDTGEQKQKQIKVKACLSGEIRKDEVELYKRLGAKVIECKDKIIFAVWCPKLPTDKELSELKEALDNYDLKPAELAALAMARGVKG